MGERAFDDVNAALSCLLTEASVPARFGRQTKRAVEEFERCLKLMFAEEDTRQDEAVSHGVVAQKRILRLEREGLLKQIDELKGWFDSQLPDYPNSPVGSTVDALARGLKRYLEDQTEFELERELSDTPAVD